jgi:hypothetical protein
MDTPTITVDCYVRAGSLGSPVDETIETLQDYDRRGRLDDLTVDLWPDEVVLTDVSEEMFPLDQYRRFRTWADRADVSLRPGFTVRERASLVSERPATTLVLPVVCLAIHVDGELSTVVPHRDGTTTYTVEDALDDLSAPDPDLPAPPRNSSTDLSVPSM